MMTVPDELLMAYADGELTADEAKALEQLLAQDPNLRVRLEPFVETRMRLAYVFEHTLHEPVPDRLIAAIARASTAPAEVRTRKRTPLLTRLRLSMSDFADTYLPSGGMTPAFAAGAVALVVASTAIGWSVGRFSAPSGLIQVAGSELLASGKLARVLESRRSGATAASDNGDVSIIPVLSFQTQAGGICREYRITGKADGPNFAGLACRTGEGQWRLALHVETPSTPESHGPYQTATSVKVPAIDALAETIIKGDAFGRDEEAELLAHGWQSAPRPGATYTPNR